MSALNRISGDAIAKAPVTVRLWTARGEVKGYGYAPQVVTGERNGKGIKYPKVRFDFTGAAGLEGAITRWTAEVEGEVEFQKIIEPSFLVGGAEDAFEIDLNAAPKKTK